MERGSVYWVNLSEARPPEMGKIRPAVLMSNSADNLRLASVVVVPLSSKPPAAWPFRIELSLRFPKSKSQSFAIIPAIRQVAKRRLEHRIGALNASELRNLSEAIDVYLHD